MAQLGLDPRHFDSRLHLDHPAVWQEGWFPPPPKYLLKCPLSKSHPTALPASTLIPFNPCFLGSLLWLHLQTKLCFLVDIFMAQGTFLLSSTELQ